MILMPSVLQSRPLAKSPPRNRLLGQSRLQGFSFCNLSLVTCNLRSLRPGQPDGEAAAGAGPARRLDVAAVGLGDVLDDRQTEASPAGRPSARGIDAIE